MNRPESRSAAPLAERVIGWGEPLDLLAVVPAAPGWTIERRCTIGVPSWSQNAVPLFGLLRRHNGEIVAVPFEANEGDASASLCFSESVEGVVSVTLSGPVDLEAAE
jgi:hypothetical protein